MLRVVPSSFFAEEPSSLPREISLGASPRSLALLDLPKERPLPLALDSCGRRRVLLRLLLSMTQHLEPPASSDLTNQPLRLLPFLSDFRPKSHPSVLPQSSPLELPQSRFPSLSERKFPPCDAPLRPPAIISSATLPKPALPRLDEA
jgi:hypothetical protein